METHDETWGVVASTEESLERTGHYNEEGTLVFPADGWVVNENGELIPDTPVSTAPPEPTWTEVFDEPLQMWVGTFTDGTTVSTWWWVHTDPLDDDSDHDGIPDGWEYEHWLHPKKASDATADPDDDALPNLAEYLNGTDPWAADTDGDSLSDGHEVNVSLTDPLDPADPGEDSGSTAPVGDGGITTVPRHQAFQGGGGGVLTLGGGGLHLGAQQQGLGNNLQPGTDPQKQSEQATSDEELYIEYRRVTRSYGPTYVGDPGNDPGIGAHSGYWNEVIDPVTNEMILREWIDTGGGSPYSGGSTEPPEAPKYKSLSTWTEAGQSRSDESEEYSSVSAVAGNLQSQSVPPNADWKPEYSYSASSGSSSVFTVLQTEEDGRIVSRGSGELVEVRLVRKTGQDSSYLVVEKDVEKTYLKVTKSRPAPYNEADVWTIDPEVKIVTLKIQEGDSKSVEDGESPVADAVLNPGIREGRIVMVSFLPVEVVELAPKVKDEEGNEIEGSEKPNSGEPLTPFVEEDPHANRIAHREIKVKIGEALKDKKVTWMLEPLPDATPAAIRGDWEQSPNHKDRFEASTAYGANGFNKVSQTTGETTIGADGHTAIRVNVPPIGFNQVRIKIQIEGMNTPIDLIDMEVSAVVVIDPGHGGTDNLPGSSANNATSPTGVLEKDLALSYGLALRDALKAKIQQDKINVKVLMTRKLDENVSGADRAAEARDNGADVVFIIHFNASSAHTARGTLEVRQLPSQVNMDEDTALIDPIIDSIVAAITPFDAGANKRAFVATDTSVAFDPKLGNTEDYHPIRAGYCEVEFLDNADVDELLNTGPDAAAVKTAIVNAMRDGILNDLRTQPATP